VVFGRSLFVLFRFAVLLAVLLGFTVSDYTCDVSDYTCDVSDYTCDVSDYTCDIFKHFLVVPLTPWLFDTF
jgi:hypothetical protein